MSPEELRDILHSDMKLWEAATTSTHPQGTAKTIDLPYGIGQRTLVFKKIDRNSVGMFGGMVRDLVNAVKGEEALAAARAVRDRSEAAIEAASEEDGGRGGGDPDQLGVSNAKGHIPVLGEETVSALGGSDDIAAGLVVRRDAILERLAQLRMKLDRYEGMWHKANKELKLLDKLLEVASACEDDGPECSDIHREVPKSNTRKHKRKQRVANTVRTDVARDSKE